MPAGHQQPPTEPCHKPSLGRSQPTPPSQDAEAALACRFVAAFESKAKKLCWAGNLFLVKVHPPGIRCPFVLACWSNSDKNDLFGSGILLLDTHIFEGFPTRTISNPELYAISINPKPTQQVVLAAVRQSGMALRYAASLAGFRALV